ncbi:MAG: hypothetical protein OXE73_15870 [Gammaproteobacteria bacterium]|nr:hypothetical protein [Gammaproteobacteria bacterium]
MKHFVERTCTVVRERHAELGRQSESSPSHEVQSRPLESFREEPAFVLLGSPGSGKTKAFEREAQRNGGCYITARDFLTVDPDPEWEDRTIYIDGLDETRAGASDGRTPFDGIRAKLHSTGRPQFRLSCREADWFGANDRERLKAVTPNGELLVLRLDPLSDQGVLESLEQNHGVDDPAAFVAEARKRGVEDLLPNPQNLRLLTEAVAEAGEWPTTRTETFDMACRRLVSEENPEHQIGWRGTADPTALLDAAGDLCATLLLTGKAGVTLPGTVPDANHPRLDQVPHGDQQLLRRAVGTNLFESPAEGRLVPVHRQVAEVVAARRLAGLIAEGCPVRRVLSLLTGFDGGVISEFRGLAAWLAAHSKPAREEIVRRDPLGVVLYGDVEDFSAREKTLVLKTLREETERNPWLVGQTTLDSPLGRLTDPGLEQEFSRALSNPARDEAHQSFVRLILQALMAGQAIPQLADPLMAIVRDDSWPMIHRRTALAAYVQVRRGDSQVAATLQSLLDDIYTGVVPTQDDGLLGTLLEELYPAELSAADLVGYLREPVRQGMWSRYETFWTSRLVEQSTIPQMVQLLALLRGPMEQVRAESAVAPRGVDFVVRPPVVLLRHLLERSPESIAQEQLVHWLGFAGWLGQEPGIFRPGGVGGAEFFRSWLTDHPDMQKAMIEQGVSRCRTADSDFHYCMTFVRRSRFGAKLPDDYGAWCADQALRASNHEVADWFAWEAAAFVYNEPEKGRCEEVAATLSSDVRLAGLFEKTLAAWEQESRIDAGPQGTPQTSATSDDGRFDDLRATVRANLTSLRANQCPLNLLHHLAVAYLDGFSDVVGETPQERLRYLLGPDNDLLRAALAGLRGAILRADLPTWTEVSEVSAQGQIHYAAYPFMVGLEELSWGENQDTQLTEAQIRLALSIHLAVPKLRHLYGIERPPRWLRASVARQPDVVAEVWIHCARHQFRKDAELLPDIYYLARQPEYAPLVSAVAIPLLRIFPIRCKAGQLTTLRSLLQAAVLYGDRTQLLELIEAKLARTSMNASQTVYWLTAGLFVEPEVYGDRLESQVAGRGRRIHRLMEMTVEPHAVPSAVKDMWDATTLERLIRLIGPYSLAPPRTGEVYVVTLPMEADSNIHSFIDRLSEDASPAAKNALEALAADDRLAHWRSKLLDRLQKQRSVCREATFVHPGLEDVAEVLANGRPTNAGDLAAFTTDVLRKVGKDLRGGSPSGWKTSWHVDQYDRVTSPLPENACRRALLLALRPLLTPVGIDAQIGGRYADDKRSDVRVACDGCNVPIEIKRSCHRELWSAIHTQLIAKYARDPGADGYGIYLVFWFGEAEGCGPTPRSGPKPKSATELRQSLLDSLSDLERRKISVCVIDVSKPEARK